MLQSFKSFVSVDNYKISLDKNKDKTDRSSDSSGYGSSNLDREQECQSFISIPDKCNTEDELDLQKNGQLPQWKSKEFAPDSSSSGSCCCNKGVLRCAIGISVLINVTLIVLIVFVCFSPEYQEIEDNFPSLCVKVKDKDTICSNYSNHLQYIFILAKKIGSESTTPTPIHTSVSVEENKVIFGKDQKLRHLTGSSNTVLLRRDKIEINMTSSYFLSLRILFKRESRKRHNYQRPIKITMVQYSDEDQQEKIILTKTLPALKGTHLVQDFKIAEIFKFNKGDSIKMSFSNGSPIYYCRNCNTLTIVKL